MKIIYTSASPIPSRFANSIHVMKMCMKDFPEETDNSFYTKTDLVFGFLPVRMA